MKWTKKIIKVSDHWPTTPGPPPEPHLQIIVEVPGKRCVHWVSEISLTVSRLSSTSSLSDFLHRVSGKMRILVIAVLLILSCHSFPLPACYFAANSVCYPLFFHLCHWNIGLPLVDILIDVVQARSADGLGPTNLPWLKEQEGLESELFREVEVMQEVDVDELQKRLKELHPFNL